MNQPILTACGYTCEEAQEEATIIAKLWTEATKVPYITDEKEATTMQVTYNGFTGELVKLERETIGSYTLYILSIYDSEKQVTHSFTGVKLEDVKFLGVGR